MGPPAHLRSCPSATKWKAEPPSTQTRICEWTLLSRREDSEMLWHHRVSQQIGTARRHICGSASGGPHAGRQGVLKRISCFHFQGPQAQPLRPSGTGVLRRAQLQTRHHRGGKLWAPRQRRQRPDRSCGGKHSRRDERIVPIAERRLQGTPIPNNLCDYSGRDFTPSSSI